MNLKSLISFSNIFTYIDIVDFTNNATILILF
nr:MAG TPA: hypothetical protein [Caudoviricetes sp.]